MKFDIFLFPDAKDIADKYVYKYERICYVTLAEYQTGNNRIGDRKAADYRIIEKVRPFVYASQKIDGGKKQTEDSAIKIGYADEVDIKKHRQKLKYQLYRQVQSRQGRIKSIFIIDPKVRIHEIQIIFPERDIAIAEKD